MKVNTEKKRRDYTFTNLDPQGTFEKGLVCFLFAGLSMLLYASLHSSSLNERHTWMVF